MDNNLSGLSPDEFTNLQFIKARVIEYWNGMSVCDDAGGTSWDVLDEIRNDVTELLACGGPDDLRLAERKTAMAEFLRQNGSSE